MTSLEKGVPTLKVETNVCKEGEKLSGEKARLLLMLGYMHAVRSHPYLCDPIFTPLTLLSWSPGITDVQGQTRFALVRRRRVR
jgi:hypothetical protein